MSETTVIGRSAFVRGRIHGSGDLEIAGRVEGEVSCSGEILVEDTGLVAANVSARRIVVRGAVKGDLAAEDAIVLEGGARVVGDLRAPRVSIAQGGLVRGYVQTGGAGASRPRAAAASTRVAPAAEKTAPKAAPPPRSSEREVTKPRGATLAGAKRVGPPPPVVPVLKKGTKAVQKKR